MHYKILVPSGIGDFSWIWSKLSTTEHTYFVEYPRDNPERLGAFLELLKGKKLTGYSVRSDISCCFNLKDLEMYFVGAPGPKKNAHSEFMEKELNSVEANTHLERGNRIETWLPDVPAVDFHYPINGVMDTYARQNIFMVHLSSRRVKASWNYYDIPVWVEMISMVQKITGWMPVFLGGSYDDLAQECFESYIDSHKAISLIGKTSNLLSALCLIQQSKFFMGAVSSGLTMLANVLRVPSMSWWPRPGLPPSWPDLSIPYLWSYWKDPELDKIALEGFVRAL